MPSKPIRILHCVGRMHFGGVETWLMHVLRNIDRAAFHIDFLVHDSTPGAFDQEILDLGSSIIPCPRPQRPFAYKRRLRRILVERGPYDVIHSHLHHFSGLILRIAQAAGVKMRIAHSHLDTSHEGGALLSRRAYTRLMRRWISRYATHGFAVSSKAGKALFENEWGYDSRWRTMYCGIDFDSRAWAMNGMSAHTELGIPNDALVVGHIGRFDTQKNHEFLLRVFRELSYAEKKAVLLLVGDGHLRRNIERQCEELGIRERVILTGTRSDVPRLLRGVVDVFVFPSLYEGLPLSVVEAQAAGLPAIISDRITREVKIVPQLLTWLSLSQPASTWASAIDSVASNRSPIPQDEAIRIARESPFNITKSIYELEKAYRGEFNT